MVVIIAASLSGRSDHATLVKLVLYNIQFANLNVLRHLGRFQQHSPGD